MGRGGGAHRHAADQLFVLHQPQSHGSKLQGHASRYCRGNPAGCGAIREQWPTAQVADATACALPDANSKVRPPRDGHTVFTTSGHKNPRKLSLPMCMPLRLSEVLRTPQELSLAHSVFKASAVAAVTTVAPPSTSQYPICGLDGETLRGGYVCMWERLTVSPRAVI